MLGLLLMVATGLLNAQETLAVGQVLNALDKSPIPDVNIFFKNTDIGVKSNEEGYFMVRTQGKETTVVFSCVGYRRKEMKLKLGQSVGVQVELQEENNQLEEVFVVPGSNPAMDLMKRVRLQKKVNDVTRNPSFSSKRSEQNLVLLGKINQRSVNKRIFEQLSKGAVSQIDSSLTLPLYMAENRYILSSGAKKEETKNIFSSTADTEKIILKLIGEIDTDQNFYDNAVSIFGKSFISPLSNSGNVYYNYYLADSTSLNERKIYQLHFRSKNNKNLAFNGSMQIDSSTLALVSISAELPSQANLNFINNLQLHQQFKFQPDNTWTFDTGNTALDLMYELLADSLHPKPRIFLNRSITAVDNHLISTPSDNFAKSNYSVDSLDKKMNTLNETPIIKVAKWLADIIITGYIPVGKVDVGKIQNLARYTDIEGFRLTLPVYTNERLWKNIRLGGYAGYGFKNNTVKYSGLAQVKLPGNQRRILGAVYTNDYRSENYDYNDFLIRENPLNSGDEDIAGTIFGLRSAGNMSERQEVTVSFSNDWSSDIESNLFFRSNTYGAGEMLPFASNTVSYDRMKQQSFTLLTRFSFGERVYDDHFQRIYSNNNKPVFYALLEGGRYEVAEKNGNYAKLSGQIRQLVNFNIGYWEYMLEGGAIFGELPYQLLKMPSGNITNGYSRFNFALMNVMEFRADRYAIWHNEVSLNGILFNQIPLIKHLNLRELMSLKMYYGSMNTTHNNVLDIPDYIHTTNKPYVEVGAGFSNLLRFITLQSFWRLTETERPGTTKWGLKGSIRISL